MTLREFLKIFQYDKSTAYKIKIEKEDEGYTFEITNTQDIAYFIDYYVSHIEYQEWQLTIGIKEVQ